MSPAQLPPLVGSEADNGLQWSDPLIHQLLHAEQGTSIVDCWLASHNEMARHLEEVHPNHVLEPCEACMPLIREEQIRFSRVERMSPDGLVTALGEEWAP